MSVSPRFIISTALLVQLWLLIGVATTSTVLVDASTSSAFGRNNGRKMAFLSQRTASLQDSCINEIGLVQVRSSPEQDDNEDEDEENQVRSAVQYSDEIETLRYSESAYLRRNKHHHMESLIVPAGRIRVYNRDSVYVEEEPIIV